MSLQKLVLVPCCYEQFMSDKSGLKTRSIGLNTIGIVVSSASSQYVIVSSSGQHCHGTLI